MAYFQSEPHGLQPPTRNRWRVAGPAARWHLIKVSSEGRPMAELWPRRWFTDLAGSAVTACIGNRLAFGRPRRQPDMCSIGEFEETLEHLHLTFPGPPPLDDEFCSNRKPAGQSGCAIRHGITTSVGTAPSHLNVKV